MPGAGWSAEGLARLLADSSTLYIKTHGFHWHVTGPMFNTLHLMFMDQYTELWHSLNLIAERIRALGHPAPGSYAQFASLSSIPEETGVPPATVIIQQLIAGQEAVVCTARGLFPLVDKAGDEPTADLLTQRLQLMRKTSGCCGACWRPTHPRSRRSASAERNARPSAQPGAHQNRCNAQTLSRPRFFSTSAVSGATSVSATHGNRD